MGIITTAAAELVEHLNGLGISTTSDPRNLTIPGALVAPQDVKASTLAPGHIEIAWDVWLVAPDNGSPIEALDPLISPLIVEGLATEFDVLALTLPNQSPDPLPAIQTTITTITEAQ